MIYTLEIYEPNNPEDTILVVDSKEPFLAISKGDLINLRAFDNSAGESLARVANVEHLFSVDAGGLVRHKICVFTHDEEDTPEERFS